MTPSDAIEIKAISKAIAKALARKARAIAKERGMDEALKFLNDILVTF